MHWDTIRPVLLKAFANTWSTRLLTKVLASTYSWRTQQDKTRVLWIPQNPWLIFEQFKDILVEYPLTLRWWFFSNSLQLDIVYFSQRLFFQHSLYNGERVDMEATKDGRLSSSHHVTLFFAEIPTKKNLLMITQFLKKCTTTVIGNEIKMLHRSAMNCLAVWPVRSKTQESFLWMLGCAWMDCLLSIFGI